MSTNADTGYGSAFGIYDGVSAYTAVAEVTALTPLGRTRDAVQATHMSSPSQYHEYIAGMMDAGETSITINFVPAVSDTIITALEAGVGQFQITHPSGIRLQFSGVVTAYTPGEINVSDKMELTFTIKATGRPTLLASA